MNSLTVLSLAIILFIVDSSGISIFLVLIEFIISVTISLSIVLVSIFMLLRIIIELSHFAVRTIPKGPLLISVNSLNKLYSYCFITLFSSLLMFLLINSVKVSAIIS
ncbi:hypothetical protein C2G38_1458545 [Gigaspora rosea]|uniref:Uncharacterized protein n=1 Tax=Gigaspora rosea TaxID=44941 RepID=A0A397W358_9GLOM|nr:hypothetical protein C2G38_1458545 [Gigaspora rosea]